MDHIAGDAADLVTRFEREDDLDALDQAIDQYEASAGVSYGRALLQRYARTGAQEDLDRGVAALLEALEQSPDEAAERATRLAGAADALVMRWDARSDPADVETAIRWFRQAMVLAPESAAPRSKLGLTIARRRLSGGGDDGDLSEALALCEEAVALDRAAGDSDGAQDRDAARAAHLGKLALVMSARAVEAEDRALAQTAVETMDGALALLPGSGPLRWGNELPRVSVLANRYVLTRRPEDLAITIAACAALLESMPIDLPGRHLAHLQYGMMIYTRFGETRDRTDREQAITVLREALGDPRPGSSLIERAADGLLRTLLWNRISEGLRLGDVDELIGRLRAQLADTPDDKELRQELYEASTARFSITGDQADLPSGEDLEDEVSRVSARVFNAIPAGLEELDAAIAVADGVLGSPGQDEDRLGNLRVILSGALYARFSHRGDRRDLDRSLALLTDAVAGAPAGGPLRGHLLTQLALHKATKYDITGDPADLRAASADAAEAARVFTAATNAVGDTDRGTVDHALGQTALRRYRRDGDPADLEAAVAAFQSAISLLPDRHLLREACAAELSDALLERAMRGGSADNAAAIGVAERAARTAPAGDQRARALLALARARSQRFLLTGDAAAADAAIDAYRRAAAELPSGRADRATALAGLSETLHIRAELTGSEADLDAAVEVGEQGWREPSAAHSRAMAAISLCDALRMRSQRTGRRSDVDTAVDVIVAAADSLAEGDLRRLLCRLQLAAVLSQRFTLTGDLADIDTCVEIARSVLGELPAHSPVRLLAYDVLSGNLWKRAGNRGDLRDLDEAIEVSDLALTVPTIDHRQRSTLLYNKAGMLRERFDAHGDRADLDVAIESAKAALAALPRRHPYRPLVAKGLALLYVSRYDGDNRDDLPEIIRLGQEGLSATRRDDPSWASHQHVVGYGLLLRFWETRRARDLRAAIHALEASVAATSPDDPSLAPRAGQLGLALNERHESRGRNRDRDGAMAAFRLAAGMTSTGTLRHLVDTRMLAGYCLRHGSPVEALEHYRVCVQELLPLAAWRGLDRASQENQLKQIGGLAGEAAAAALACDSPRAAVQLLEQSRSVLWAQLLETRSDRSELRARHPELAAEFDEVSAILDGRGDPRAPGSLQPGELGSAGRLAPHQEADRRRHATARFSELRDRVRELPGFAAFLRPPDFAALLQTAARGPVVIVNVDRLRCDALLLTTGGLLVLPLPGLSKDDATRRARAFHQALAVASQGRATSIAAAQTVLATLEWLWDAVAQPVLDALALPAGSRIWWCPTGPLATLPLHAAGRHRPGGTTTCAGEHVVSSYTPTLQALLRARNTPAAPLSATTLVTALSVTPRPDGRYPDLPHVPTEVKAIKDALGARAVVLKETAATRQAVLDAIPAHPRVHFACHGGQDPDRPSASHLALHDADLTVLDLTTVGVEGGDLAFLSACETAQGDTALTDEAIHLAAAFHLIGYRHVIGTLWSLNDASAAEVAKDVYEELTRNSATEPAVALHRAVTRLRAQSRSPMIWAPFVHIGA
ncbi:CHAT domain-containing protein [Nonomuraea wenchangensis]